MVAPAHTDSLNIPVALQPPFPSVAGFGTLLLLELAADNSSGQTVKSYKQSDLDQIETDWTTAIRDAAEVYFSARPAPDRILIGEWDKNGGDTVQQALDKIDAANNNWFYVASTIRDDTDQESISNTIESYAKPSVYFLTSSSDDLVATQDTTNWVVAFSNVVDNARERTFLLYHTASDEYVGASLAGKLSGWDQDNRSPGFFGALDGISGYGSLPSGADIGSAQSPGIPRGNNVNLVLPFGSEPTWLAPGVNGAGRQGKVIVTKYWYQDRLQAEVANEIQTADANGRVIPVGAVGESETDGQERMAKLVRQKYEQGADIGHFLKDNINIDYPQVTSSDVSSGIIPLEAQITVLIGGQAVTFNVSFTRDAV